MMPGHGKPLTQQMCEERKFSPLMMFECRGYEPVDYVFAGGWKVESVSFSSSHTTFQLCSILYKTFLLYLWMENDFAGTFELNGLINSNRANIPKH